MAQEINRERSYLLVGKYDYLIYHASFAYNQWLISDHHTDAGIGSVNSDEELLKHHWILKELDE